MNVEDIFKLYKECFTDIIREDNHVKKVLSDKENHIIRKEIDKKLIGVSVINKNTIYLFCVDESFENHENIKEDLLDKSEKYIKGQGYDKVVLGAGKEYITPGIPMNNNAHEFFKNHGYIHSWGEASCLDMNQNLDDFKFDDYKIGSYINGIQYRLVKIDDLEKVIDCVNDGYEKFTKYYSDIEKYKDNSKNPIMIAIKDGKVLGTLLISIEVEAKGLGSVGCTVTRNNYRGQGIATNIVIFGTKYLKDLGLKKAFLGYTYTDIVNIYARAGYKICMEYFMGEKKI